MPEHDVPLDAAAAEANRRDVRRAMIFAASSLAIVLVAGILAVVARFTS